VKQFSDDMNDSSSTGAFFTGLFAGAVIGAGLGLWFAPKTGAEMREQIGGAARDLGQRASKTVNDLSERGREVFDRAREVVANVGDQAERVAGDASKAASNVASTVRRTAQHAGSQATSASERS
jgi:gas vesicle protein